MFKQFFNEVTITLELEPDGPVLIKAGESGADPTRPDMEFVRTIYQGRETVYFPGSSLKGVIRAHCERLARTVQPEKIALILSEDRLTCDPLHPKYSCGEQWREEQAKNSAPKAYRLSCFVCRLFGNTHLSSRVRLTDAYPVAPGEVKTEERNGVAIDRVFGSVAVGPFNYEAITSGVFNCRIQVRNYTIAQLGLLALALRDLERQCIGVGYAKSRGLGRIKTRVTEAYFRYPACTLNGTLTLMGGKKPGTSPGQLAGAGSFNPDKEYGLNEKDVVNLPEGVFLTADEWGEPYLKLTEDDQIKALWRECVQAWQQAAKQAVNKK